MDLEFIKNIVSLITRLENLCEGFDISNKSVLLTSKIKILSEIDKAKSISPSILKTKVGLAKSNLALICSKMLDENLIEVKKDDFDARVKFYSLTENGKTYLNTVLQTLNDNFVRELAYKNNLKQINEEVKNLDNLIK